MSETDKSEVGETDKSEVGEKDKKREVSETDKKREEGETYKCEVRQTRIVKSSQVTFIYIAPLTIQIVTKHCTISK